MNYNWLGLDINNLLDPYNQYWRYHLLDTQIHAHQAACYYKLNFVASRILFSYRSIQDLLGRASLGAYRIHRVVVHIE